MSVGLTLFVLGSACTVRRTVDDDDDGGGGASSGGVPSDDDDAGGDTSGGFGSTTTGGGSSYTVADACAGIANHEAVCFEGEVDEVACQQAGACFRLITRDEAEPQLLSCYAEWAAEPACTASHCIDKVFLPPELAHDLHRGHCSSFASRCGVDGGDICRNDVSHLESGLLEAIAPCFDAACGSFDACVANAVDGFTGGCESYPLL